MGGADSKQSRVKNNPPAETAGQGGKPPSNIRNSNLRKSSKKGSRKGSRSQSTSRARKPKSKIKPGGGSNIKGTSKFVDSAGRPKSKITFTSLGFEGKENGHDLGGFLPLGKINATALSINERNLDYAEERNEVNKSQLVTQKQILNYDLDDQGGVAWTAQVPTFCYSTHLKHDNYYKNRNLKDQRNVSRNSIIRKSSIQNRNGSMQTP